MEPTSSSSLGSSFSDSIITYPASSKQEERKKSKGSLPSFSKNQETNKIDVNRKTSSGRNFWALVWRPKHSSDSDFLQTPEKRKPLKKPSLTKTQLQKRINIFRSTTVSPEDYAKKLFSNRTDLGKAKANTSSTSIVDFNIDMWYPLCLTTLQLYENFLKRIKHDPDKINLLKIIKHITLNGLIPVEDLIDPKVREKIDKIFDYFRKIATSEKANSTESLKPLLNEFETQYQNQYGLLFKINRSHSTESLHEKFEEKRSPKTLEFSSKENSKLEEKNHVISFRETACYFRLKGCLLLKEYNSMLINSNTNLKKEQSFENIVKRFVNVPIKELVSEFHAFQKDHSSTIFFPIFSISNDITWVMKHILGCMSPTDFIPTASKEQQKFYPFQIVDLQNRLQIIFFLYFFYFKTEEGQAKVLCFLYVLLKDLLDHHDFPSAATIYSILSSKTLRNFTSAWEIFEKHFCSWESLEKDYQPLFDNAENYKYLRNEIQNLRRRSIPYIPFTPLCIGDVMIKLETSCFNRENFTVDSLKKFESLMEDIFLPFPNVAVSPLKTMFCHDLTNLPLPDDLVTNMFIKDMIDLSSRLREQLKKDSQEFDSAINQLLKVSSYFDKNGSSLKLNQLLSVIFELQSIPELELKLKLTAQASKELEEKHLNSIGILIKEDSQVIEHLHLFLDIVDKHLSDFSVAIKELVLLNIHKDNLNIDIIASSKVKDFIEAFVKVLTHIDFKNFDPMNPGKGLPSAKKVGQLMSNHNLSLQHVTEDNVL